MGIDPLPEEAFIAASLGWRRHLTPLAGPFARGALLALSPYYRKRP